MNSKYGNKRIIKKMFLLFVTVFLAFGLSACARTNREGAGNWGTGGSWRPAMPREIKVQCVKRAIEIVRKELGVETSAGDYKDAVFFSGDNVLYADEKSAMEHRADWQYRVYLYDEVGNKYHVYVTYDDMELISLNVLNPDIEGLEGGKIGGVNKTLKEELEGFVPAFLDAVRKKNEAYFRDFFCENVQKNITADDIKDFLERAADLELCGAYSYPCIFIKNGTRTDAVYDAVVCKNSRDEKVLISVARVVSASEPGNIGIYSVEIYSAKSFGTHNPFDTDPGFLKRKRIYE